MKDKYNKPWYDFSGDWLGLKEEDFILPEIEKEWVLNLYLEIINLDKSAFNYEAMKKNGAR